ncbi:UDP-N-acetylmuramoylalanine--D-glutamate ligase [Methylomarinovum tepidoasis]|uniref:UDP-N-acetylmuramoylalanine--D-glutamate ligase n=1 Tax=Methylomarinovum tepidoasis TaxID=2840183 RepID=A0AAU9C870_9GAMM|nr:UDP-N-acetylmuramoyl-L-alanine--D-glutamate ligase [Methylomarinovum sp. IN45]BCX88022.1 UDP-N-acetylmuramoylalanine--D-glutamate ligase [Methylomarinovum sp. IN45]
MTGLDTLLGSEPRVAVVGLGRTGVSVVRHLHARGIDCLAADTRDRPPGLESVRRLSGVSVFTGGLSASILSWATHLVVSPGVPLDRPEIRATLERGVALVSDVDLFAVAAAAPVVAVTGSNGKSTVTTLVAEMAAASGLQVRAGGNLGVPALELLDDACQLYVLELSSFQLERSRYLRPLAGAVLNLSPDHLDHHRDFAAYTAAKGRLLRWSRWRVVNADDSQVMQLAGRQPQRLVRFGLDAGADWHLQSHGGQTWLACRGEPLLAATEIPLRGRHNLANALAALALAEAAGLPREAALTALRGFAGLPHRMQTVAEIDGVTWINDSKGTNVGATEAAIAGLAGPIVLIAGGDGKGADFTPLRAAAAGKVKVAILYGRDRQRLADALAPAVPVELVEDLDQAVAAARRQACASDTVLLSPACASFDQFRDYQARGDHFTALVQRWQSAA